MCSVHPCWSQWTWIILIARKPEARSVERSQDRSCQAKRTHRECQNRQCTDWGSWNYPATYRIRTDVQIRQCHRIHQGYSCLKLNCSWNYLRCDWCVVFTPVLFSVDTNYPDSSQTRIKKSRTEPDRLCQANRTYREYQNRRCTDWGWRNNSATYRIRTNSPMSPNSPM